MYKFIRYFIMGWQEYPSFKHFCDYHFGVARTEAVNQMDKDPERARKMCNSRFWYAIETAKVYYKHRDRYGRKCRKFGGDCEKCNAKHC